MIQWKYMLLAYALLVIMLVHLIYPLMMRVLLTSQGMYQMLRNRLKLMIHTLASKLQLQILNLPVAVKNKFAFTGPANDNHQATILVDLLVYKQLDNATL